MLKLQPALVAGYSSKQPKLTETSLGSGAADLGFFNRYNSGDWTSRTIDPFRDIRFAMCLNDYPEFMSIK